MGRSNGQSKWSGSMLRRALTVGVVAVKSEGQNNSNNHFFLKKVEVGVIDQMPIWPFCLGETLDNVSKVMSPQCRCGFPGSQVANAVWLRRLPACLPACTGG